MASGESPAVVRNTRIIDTTVQPYGGKQFEVRNISRGRNM